MKVKVILLGEISTLAFNTQESIDFFFVLSPSRSLHRDYYESDNLSRMTSSSSVFKHEGVSCYTEQAHGDVIDT